MAAVDQLYQSSRVDMRVNLGRRNVGMAEERLEHAKVGSAREQMSGEGVTQHVRTDPVGGDSGGKRHFPHQLEKPDPAKMRLAARE